VNKKADFQEFINCHKPDIIIGTETWLSASICDNEIVPAEFNYNIYRKDRADGYGGVMVAVSKVIPSYEMTALQTECELLWIHVVIGNGSKLLVGAYYKPHIDDQHSIDELSLSLQKLNETTKDAKVWLIGDFNAPCIDWESMSLFTNRTHVATHYALIDVMLEYGLEQIVDQPTRHQNILDLFFLNHPNDEYTVNILPGLGDHDIVSVDINVQHQINKLCRREIYLYDRADWDSIRQDVISLMDTSEFNSPDDRTVDELWMKFKDTVMQSMRSHIPRKFTRTRCDLPWLTSTIRKQIRKRNKLYHQYKTSHSEDVRTRFLTLKHDIQRQLRQSHDAHISKLITTNSEDGSQSINTKKFWSFIKKLKKDSNGVQALKVDGEVILNSKEKANAFNSYFKSVFSNEPEKIPNKGSSPHPIMGSIEVTTAGIVSLLHNLDAHKASGPDEISTRFLKETAAVTAPVLRIIFEKSLETGNIPYDWRVANVAPIYKKGERSAPQNYRPISLTSTVSKVLEHIISSHLMKHLENNNILHESQHGFRHNRSCETQLISFINDLCKSYDSGKQTDVILMDIAKAFDTVPHNRLRHKLQWYGVTGNSYRWISSFLRDRYQRVTIDNVSSDLVAVTSGVPQGTVLGPILFIIYMNDVVDNIKYSKIRLFADDIILYKEIETERDVQQLQEDLNSLQQWEATWLLKFSIPKCHVLKVTRATKHKILSNYYLHDTVLEVVENCKYLGVTVQSDLRWSKHIQNITTKASRTLSFLKRNLKLRNQHIKETAYFSLVRPQLEYASIVWSPWQRRDVEKLERINRRAARFVTNDFYRTSSVTNMIHQLGWQQLETRRQNSRLSFFHKIIHHQTCVSLGDITSTSPERTTLTRSDANNVVIPFARTDTYQHSFGPSVCNSWNNLPTYIKETITIEHFKNQINQL